MLFLLVTIHLSESRASTWVWVKIDATRGPQVLVVVPIYQGNPLWVSPCLTHLHTALSPNAFQRRVFLLVSLESGSSTIYVPMQRVRYLGAPTQHYTVGTLD